MTSHEKVFLVCLIFSCLKTVMFLCVSTSARFREAWDDSPKKKVSQKHLKFEFFKTVLVVPTPPKFNMEPKKKFPEKTIPFGNLHFQVPCEISGVYDFQSPYISLTNPAPGGSQKVQKSM